MIEFDRIVAVVNPASSQAHSAAPRLHNLQEQFANKSFDIIDTSADPEQTVEDIVNKTEPGDIGVVIGGDGTFHYAMLATVGRDIPLLPLWGGNGNDISHMLNGRPVRASRTHELIREGEVVAIHPIELAMSGLKNQYAAVYGGFGLSAESAEILNDPAHRSRPGYRVRPFRAIQEAKALIPQAFSEKTFTVTTPDGLSHHEAVDLSFFNGNRVAKYGRLPVSLNDVQLYTTECRSKLDIPRWLSTMALGKVAGEHLPLGDAHSFRLDDAVCGHVDAETFEVPAGTGVRVGLYPDTYTAVSTRLS